MILLSKHAYAIPRMDVRMIARGNKIFQMKLRYGRLNQRTTPTQFHDSFNIIPVALAKFITTLSLKDNDGTPLIDKGFFNLNV